MLAQSLILLALSTTLSALPSRTHCRCTLTPSDASSSLTSPSPSQQQPASRPDSLANPDTLTRDARTPNLCSALGPALESLRHTDAELYASYISQTLSLEEEEARQRQESAPDATREEKPVETSVLLRIAAAQGFQGWGVGEGGEYVKDDGEGEEKDERRDTEEGGVRIRCWAAEGGREEVGEERWTVYEVSWVTLVVLQVVVGLVVVACAAEGVVLVWGWLSASCTTPETPLLTTTFTRPAPLRLDGDEKRLLATPAQNDRMNFLRSPGVEKKLRAYEAPDYDRSTARWQHFAEDDEDECNRPVM